MPGAKLGFNNVIEVDNYVEAAGVLLALARASIWRASGVHCRRCATAWAAPPPGRSRYVPPVSREPLIGLMTDSGPRLAVGLLGILKWGGRSSPAPRPARGAPALHDRRLRYRLVVTEARHLELALRVGEAAGCLRKVACLDDPGELPPLPAGIEVRTLAGFVPRQAPAAAAAEPPAESLAYVIYTSGSTGSQGRGSVARQRRPDAALEPRRVRSRRADAGAAEPPYAFDFGVWEILTTLVSGGALHTLEPGETGDPVAYGRRAVAAGIDVVHATPSFFRAVAETGVRLEGLRVLHLGGEALSRPQVERLAAAVGPDCVLYNGYGPTEATVNSLIFAAGRPGELRAESGCRSAGRRRTTRSTCSTAGRSRCRSGSAASSGSAAPGWRAAISAGRS